MSRATQAIAHAVTRYNTAKAAAKASLAACLAETDSVANLDDAITDEQEEASDRAYEVAYKRHCVAGTGKAQIAAHSNLVKVYARHMPRVIAATRAPAHQISELIKAHDELMASKVWGSERLTDIIAAKRW